MTGRSAAVVVLAADTELESSIRAALESAASDVRVITPSPTEWRGTVSASAADCIVWAGETAAPAPDSVSDATDTAGDTASVEAVRDAAPHSALILYPGTADPELARSSTDRGSVRYLPRSIDTDERSLLVDAVETAIEATEREQLLEERCSLLAQTSALADVGGWKVDAGRREVEWTAETYRLHGVDESFEPTVDESIGFYLPADRGAVRDDIENALDGEPFDSTYRLRRADGEVRWVRSRGEPTVEDGDVTGVIGSFQDVTPRKHREEETRRFKRAVEAAGHAIFITKRNGEITYVNPAFESITGYDAAEAVGRDPSILKSGEMDPEYYTNLWSTVLGGEVWSQPIVNARKSGEHYHASETIAPIVGDDGAVEGFVAIQTDVTEQVHTKEQLETFREIVHRLEDPIMLQGRDGTFDVVNDAVAEYAGIPKDQLIGLDERAFMNDTAAQEIQRRKSHVLEREQTITYEVDPVFPTKGKHSFVTTRYPHYDEDGSVDGTVAICRDITEQAEREHQLHVLDRVLRHNLYNKMNLILGHAEILESGTNTTQRSARKIRETGEELVSLADKERRIVDLLTGGSVRQRVEVCALLEEIVTERREAHPDHDISVDCPEPFEVQAIPEIREAISELIENAIIHAEESPRVSVAVAREGERIVVTITDTGPGIPEMERKAAQGVTDITQLFHGSGLGLQFVYHAAKRSGGSLRFASPAPDGSGTSAAKNGVGTDGDAIGAIVELHLPVPDGTGGDEATDAAVSDADPTAEAADSRSNRADATASSAKPSSETRRND
ncbi:PAS domain S-box protein [Halobellus sp. GM3]|uniref:PAS domain S-box protein n=1 Tax=Halobellus sp. GM3 TaxID=3458410 RepID=UPI00403E1644